MRMSLVTLVAFVVICHHSKATGRPRSAVVCLNGVHRNCSDTHRETKTIADECCD